VVGLEEKKMYTGTLINDLISTVERTQTRADERVRKEKLSFWYLLAECEMATLETDLVGVA
jgi:hypothetical protein